MKQLKLQSQGHGGIREGAGRKKSKTAGASHRKRALVTGKHPLHITVRMKKGAPSLRKRKTFRIFCRACKGANENGLRVLHYAVLGNHFHILAEADDNQQLAKGMRSLNIRIARGMKARVQEDRFHAEPLTTPTQMKNAMVYVFTNAAKHAGHRQAFDEFSSYIQFEGTMNAKAWDWRKPSLPIPEHMRGAITEAESWLARVGWQRGGRSA